MMNRDEQPRRRRPSLRVYLFAAFALTMLMGLSPSALAQSQWTTNGTNISNTNSGNVGIGTAYPPYTVTVQRDYNGPTNLGVFNTADGTSAAAGIGVSRTTNYSDKYLGLGVTAPSYSSPGFGETAYLLSRGVPIKFGTQTGNDIHFSTNGIANTRLTIASGGNVGIGNINMTAYSARLAVQGPAGGMAFQSTDNVNSTVAISHQSIPIANTVFFRGTGGSNLYLGANETGVMMINNSGNVGVGTTTPQAKLDVQGNVSVAGNITATGNIAAKYQDVAEWVPSRQKLAAHTVVVLDPEQSNSVMASTSAYDMRVAGVVSAAPGVILGEGGAGKVMVATTGRVKVKVDATRAPIRVGDLLVTGDIPGVAMRSEPVNVGGIRLHRPGTLIGKALEPLAKGEGEILVLLSLQ